MGYDQLELLFYISLGLGIFLLALTAFLFFRLRIVKVVLDLTGIKAKKAIKEIREQNRLSGDKAYKPSAVNMQRGRITERMPESGEAPAAPPAAPYISIGTMQIGDAYPAAETAVLPGDSTLVPNPPETAVLADNPQSVYAPPPAGPIAAEPVYQPPLSGAAAGFENVQTAARVREDTVLLTGNPEDTVLLPGSRDDTVLLPDAPAATAAPEEPVIAASAPVEPAPAGPAPFFIVETELTFVNSEEIIR